MVFPFWIPLSSIGSSRETQAHFITGLIILRASPGIFRWEISQAILIRKAAPSFIPILFLGLPCWENFFTLAFRPLKGLNTLGSGFCFVLFFKAQFHSSGSTAQRK